MTGYGFLHLGASLGDGICFSRDDAHGDNAGCTGGKRSGAGMGAAGETPKTGINTLGEANFHLQRIVFQLARDIRTRVLEAGGGADLRGGGKRLREKNLGTFEIGHRGHGAVGICDFRQAHTGERGVELLDGFYFWKLHHSEIKLDGKCGKGLEKQNKGGKADHGSGLISQLEIGNEILLDHA